MKKLNKSYSFGMFVILGIAVTACGKSQTQYNQQGKAGSTQSATTLTSTPLEGEWGSCVEGALTTWWFTGNGYWTAVDQYSSSDCSDSSPSSKGTPSSGTFQLGSVSQAGNTQQITLLPNGVSGAQTESGFVQVIAVTHLQIEMNGITSYLDIQN